MGKNQSRRCVVERVAAVMRKAPATQSNILFSWASNNPQVELREVFFVVIVEEDA